ncbi:MAG: isochorismatase family cysteine hydrolase [Anaerovoracaceae bacterium]|nr:isochorismatase family cysteine hydrolase [Anaerovoracaceae bacterium]
MRNILIIVDMQDDFIDGSLGTSEAEEIVPSVIAKMKSYDPEDVWATRDTHGDDYLETQEGRNLPVRHCIRGTPGWQLVPDIEAYVPQSHVIDKPGFGSIELVNEMKRIAGDEEIAIELVGLCTDICVVANAELLKAFLPETPISVDGHCCAGVTPEKHEAALETMRSCQIDVK